MGFGDLKTASGQKALNDFLAERSFIEGYEPSQADAVVFSALTGAPAASLAHALRWWNNINSYGGEKASFPGAKKGVEAYGPGGAAPAAGGDDDDDDDDFDLFGSDDDDEDTKAEAEKIKQERLAAYAAKKKAKPGIIAKSNIILDVKPWDDETDMKVLEEHVRSIEQDGLLWGAAKLVPVGYGIKKLQISCVVEDDKVSTDDLEEKICAFEDFVQSMDIAAFNKV